ncbi:hypothetical protein KIKIMORA_02120 [Brevundimonas phage vB_BpoS-Kikimora]|uniref:Uncharacterized protein n=1 Tax=Brevundimonas phage vB_BpoS-Kikimora TaxID=2948601 RepID=A0A9E7MS28_9CAUD|nr:hypothetical protein KIKIMORA_02120 [Brevundimonas phage vB_BpoS-Kikimora]
MALSKEDAFLLREGDWVLVPARVSRTNSFWSNGGVSVHLDSPFRDQRPFSEQQENPRRPEMSCSGIIHSVLKLPLKVGDWVEPVEYHSDAKGQILFIDSEAKEAVVRMKGGNRLFTLENLRRTLSDAQREQYLSKD